MLLMSDSESNSLGLPIDIQKELLEHIELRGGICVYVEKTRQRIFECLVATYPDLFALSTSRKRQVQNKIFKWKRWPLERYIDLLDSLDIVPHEQTIRRQYEQENNVRRPIPIKHYPQPGDSASWFEPKLQRTTRSSRPTPTSTSSTPQPSAPSKETLKPEEPTEHTSTKRRPTMAPNNKKTSVNSGYPPGYDEQRCGKWALFVCCSFVPSFVCYYPWH